MTDAAATLAVALDLVKRGWSPLPLPARAKTPPPEGFTGYRGRMATVADVKAWDWSGNMAIRLPPDVIGIDVDAYKGGTVDPLETKYGPLPPTVWVTSRDDGSGIALFRVPPGTTIEANPADGIEAIQHGHRYMVGPGSVHPSGGIYRAIDENTGDELDRLPDIDDLPELPWAWIDGLRAIKTQTAPAADADQVVDFVRQRAGRTAPGRLRGIERRLADWSGSRHDTLVEVACWAMREAAAGAYTAADAIDLLERWWNRVMDDPRRLDGPEFGDAIRWAVAQAALEPGRVDEIRADMERHRTESRERPPQATESAATAPRPPTRIDPVTGEIRPLVNLPDEFWNARPELAHIRQAAHARRRSADAVLLFSLARIAATVHPSYTLPAITGGQSSLNFLGAVVAPSGGGKSSAGAVARDLVPIRLKTVMADVPPGSGEGLAELFFELVTEEGADGKKRKVKRQTKTGAFIYLDEGEALAQMGSRKGATLLPTLRAAWSAEVIGQSNATQETHRVLKPHAYRMAIVVGFQPEYAADLISDQAGGTPQRFVFAAGSDPSIPDKRPAWPGRLPFEAPHVVGGGVEFDVADVVADEIDVRALAAARGEPRNPLDSHRDLVRLRVAALFGLLDGRTGVNDDDWHLSGVFMAASDAVRADVMVRAQMQAAEREQAHTERQTAREAASERAAERRAVQSGARSLARRVWKLKAGEMATRADVTRAVRSTHRKIADVDEMIDHAVGEEWIEPTADGWRKGRREP